MVNCLSHQFATRFLALLLLSFVLFYFSLLFFVCPVGEPHFISPLLLFIPTTKTLLVSNWVFMITRKCRHHSVIIMIRSFNFYYYFLNIYTTNLYFSILFSVYILIFHSIFWFDSDIKYHQDVASFNCWIPSTTLEHFSLHDQATMSFQYHIFPLPLLKSVINLILCHTRAASHLTHESVRLLVLSLPFRVSSITFLPHWGF